MNRIFKPTLLALLMASNLACADGISDLYRLAKDNDPDYAAARFSQMAGQENRKIGLAGLLPTIQSRLSYTNVNQDLTYANQSAQTSGRDVSLTRDTKLASISLSQPIFNLQKFKDYDLGEAKAELSNAIFAEAQQDLILRVSKAFFDYLLAKDNLELAEAQKKSLSAYYTQAQHLFEGGVATITDVEESNARYQISDAQVLVAKNALDVSLVQLEKVVGKLPESYINKNVTYDIEALLPEPNDVSTWVESAKKQNLKVMTAILGIRISELEYEKAYARHYPYVDLSASYQTANQLSEFISKSENASVGVDVTIPIYQGGLVTAESRRLLNLKDKAEADRLSAEKTAVVMSTESFLGVVGGVSRIYALKQAVKSSEVALKGMEIGQQAGFRTNTDVLNAQQQLYSAKRDLQKERYDYLYSRLKLNASIGGLTEQEILTLDKMLIPTSTRDISQKTSSLRLDNSLKNLGVH